MKIIKDVEKGLLSCIMWDASILTDISDIISVEMFTTELNKAVYNSITTLTDEGVGVNVMSIIHHLQKCGKLEEIGGNKALIELSTYGGNPYEAISMARAIAENYTRVTIGSVGQELSILASDLSVDVFDLVGKAEKSISGVISGIGSQAKTSEAMYKDIITSINNPVAHEVNSIPIHGLNGQNGNIEVNISGGNYIIVAARPGMGKTATMCEWVREELNKGYPVLVFSLEMTAQELHHRLVSAQCGIDSYSLKTGKLTKGEEERLLKNGQTIEGWKLIIEDNVTDMAKIKALSRKYKKKYPNMRMIFKDYLQLTRGRDNDNRGANRDQLIGYYTGTGKSLAKELNVTFVDLAQVGRGGEKTATKKPTLADLRESGNIEQDADIVIFLYRPAYYGIFTNEAGENITNQIEFIVAKYRGGQVGNGFANIDLAKNLISDIGGYVPIQRLGVEPQDAAIFDTFKNDIETPF